MNQPSGMENQLGQKNRNKVTSHIFVQLGLLFAVCLLGEVCSYLIDFPASIISMFLLFVFLYFHVIKEEQIAKTSDFLLQNLSFVFIPPTIEIVSNYHYIRDIVWIFIFICVLSTILTFLATAYTVKLVIALQEKRRRPTKIASEKGGI